MKMYRRPVSLLLLPCVLLTQSASLSHWHVVKRPAGHDVRPHFHTRVGWAADTHKHGHHHHGRGGHHHHHNDGAENAACALHPPQLTAVSDHDSDAVFVAASDSVVAKRF